MGIEAVNGPTSGREAGTPAPAVATQRLQSLDAYRGLIMVTLAFTGFGLAATANNHLKAGGDPDVWRAVHYQFEHVEWVGCGYWDLIQPSFMFMVGVAMAFSYSKRGQTGHSYGWMLAHAAWRSLILIFLGIFLISTGRLSTDWSLVNVLTQIGLGYTFLFLFWNRPTWVQALGVVAILGGTWLLYECYPTAGIPLQTGAPHVGVSAEWAQAHLADVRPAWHKNANVGHAVDVWVLNLLPRVDEFRFNGGGYQTINFLPSLATMLMGLMAGELLRTSRGPGAKFLVLVLAGLAGLAAGFALDWTGACPLVKRIWTPSWALFSTGWCLLILAGLYAVIDVLGVRAWSWPLLVVGVNSIAIYCMSMTLKGWVGRSFKTHLGDGIFKVLGDLNEPAVQATVVGLVFWLVCLWLYRHKVFIRI